MAHLNLIIPTFLVVLGLVAGLSYFYGRSRIRRALLVVLAEHRNQPSALPDTQVSGRGLPADVTVSLDAFVTTVKEHYDAVVASNDQLRASNRVYAYTKSKFEGLLDAMTDGIVVLDMSGIAVMANQSAATYLGIDRQKILQNPPYEWLGFQEWNRLSPGSGAAELHIDLQRSAPHGQRTLRVAAKSFGRTPHLSGHAIIIRDMTEQVLAEQARGEFVAHVAHELKTPLSTLKSYTEVLMDGEASDEATKRELYNVINEEADRLAGLIGNLLSVTKIEMGSLQIDTSRVKTREFLEEVFRIAEAQKKGRNIDMQLVLPDVLPAIKADKDLLRVALLNLMSNALKYTDDGGTVVVSAEEDDDALIIAVRDSGIGIPEEDLPHIFDKFYRSHDKRALERPGHGLGLALTQQIVHLHDGEIQVTTRPNQGSRFTVILKKAEDYLE